ncbi:PP2C family protein-serine/threonine phosphatase [Cellulomonas soli]|uniref:Serine/threonine protein phosphatase PstP n=1 Tax=Cellulomonas soli TaxID=931535 RepID=A0A512PIC8_9CELL|nr:PP2C family serine/threonine-protein phosphatase [Cellulomonas soli]NYI58669.1 protein phosphatase [Cellulomonas soli]GEP70946.1 serine/threonine protein phosphatase [Cellulomonas soli]
MTVALRYAARSDVGLVRANNQDSAYAGPHLLMVADGMGGHAGGDVASSMAVAAFAPLDGESHGPDDALDELEEALALAHEELVARTESEPELAGMGTTVTAILRAGNKLAMMHLGDSRGYLLRDGTLTQVTADHTFVQHLVDTGKITPEEAEHHPQRSVVMRVLGAYDTEITPDLSVREARPGDRWLLCSDGLSGFVSHDTIEQTMVGVPDVDACADLLVQLALRAGGGDNVTVVVADVVELDAVADGSGPTTAASVVGAAAISRNAPSAAADGPAARAARLTQTATDPLAAGGDPADGAAPAAVPPPGGELVDELPRTHRVRTTIVWVAIALVLGASGYLAYRWTQTQYYVGVDGTNVAVFRGLPQDLGPISLSSIVEESDVAVDDLSAYLRTRVEGTIQVTSLDAAQAMVATLAADAEANG